MRSGEGRRRGGKRGRNVHNHVHIMCNISNTYHVQHAVCHLVRRDSSTIQFDRVYFSFILLAETITR